jgi:hypothetical protein
MPASTGLIGKEIQHIVAGRLISLLCVDLSSLSLLSLLCERMGTG